MIHLQKLITSDRDIANFIKINNIDKDNVKISTYGERCKRAKYIKVNDVIIGKTDDFYGKQLERCGYEISLSTEGPSTF